MLADTFPHLAFSTTFRDYRAVRRPRHRRLLLIGAPLGPIICRRAADAIVAIFDDLSSSSVLGSTSGNAFPPTISVLRRVESIFPRQFQSSQVFADGLRRILPRSSSSPFSPWSPVHHLFGSSILVHSGHMTQPRLSFPSDDVAQLLLSCSFPDCLTD